MERFKMLLQLFAELPEYTALTADGEPLFTTEEPADADSTGDGDGDDAVPDDIAEDGADKDPIFFPRLRAVDKNLPHTQMGALVVADEDGNLLSVEVDEGGEAREQYLLIEDDNVVDGALSGAKLQEATITSRELDMEEIFSDSELIKQLLAMNIDAASLFDNEGFIERYDERYLMNFAGAKLMETDLNEVTEPGRYCCVAGENILNKPMEGNEFALDVLKIGVCRLQQEFRAGKEIYVREGKEEGAELENTNASEGSGIYEWKAWTRRYLSPVDITGEEVDLNDFTFANGYADGQWKCTTDDGSKDITPLPEGKAFVLMLSCLKAVSQSDYVMHMRVLHGETKSGYERWCVNGDWTEWTQAHALFPQIIPERADLNDFTQSGMYYCPVDATAATLGNRPSDVAFFMLVGRHAGTFQMIAECLASSPAIHFRNFHSGTWGQWHRQFTTCDLDVSKVTEGTLPNERLDLSEVPVKTVHWNRGYNESANTTTRPLIMTSNDTPSNAFWYVQTMRFADDGQRFQIAYGYNHHGVYTRYHYALSGGWSEWVRIFSSAEQHNHDASNLVSGYVPDARLDPNTYMGTVLKKPQGG